MTTEQWCLVLQYVLVILGALVSLLSIRCKTYVPGIVKTIKPTIVDELARSCRDLSYVRHCAEKMQSMATAIDVAKFVALFVLAVVCGLQGHLSQTSGVDGAAVEEYAVSAASLLLFIVLMLCEERHIVPSKYRWLMRECLGI